MTKLNPIDLTDDQVRALYSLILGDGPHLDIGTGSRRILELAAALLSSEEFNLKVAEPALEGTLEASDEGAEAGVQAWAERVFALPHLDGEPRLSMLARVVESPALAPLLSSLPVVWSTSALADALRAAFPQPTAFWTPPPNAAAAIARISRGLRVQHLSGLSIGAGPQELRLDLGERWVMFQPFFDGVASTEYCRVEFGLISEAECSDSALYIDYAEGFCSNQVLPLEARGRSRYSAFLAVPGSIKTLRWDLAKLGRSARLTLLSARAISSDDVARRIMAVAGEPGLDWLGGRRLPNLRPHAPEPMPFRLSRALTRSLGAHESERRYSYSDWIADNELSGPLKEAQDRRELALLRARPKIDLVLLTDNPDALAVRETIESVRRQSYPDWMLHVVPLTAAAIASQRLWAVHVADERVAPAPAIAGTSVSAALNAVLARADGYWLGVLRSGELLRPDALLHLIQKAATSTNTATVYADHDHLDQAGVRSAPAFKPDFAPETLLGFDYIAMPALLHAGEVRAIGGWDETAAGAENYDLMLRLTRMVDPGRVAHVAEILGHRPQICELDWHLEEAAMQAVARHLDSVGRDLVAEPLGSISGRRIRSRLPDPRPLVSLVIPTRDQADLLGTCISSILKLTDYDPVEIVVVDNGSVEAATKALFESWEQNRRIRVLSEPGPFNYARINNAAVTQARGEVIGLINNDVEAIAPGWLEELVSWAVQPEIGCVGAKLVFPNDTIQHGGIVLGIGGIAAHAHKYDPRDSEGYNGRLARVHNVSAVTGACLVVRRALYEAMGGLDEAFAIAYNDVDFCLRVEDAGYRNLFTPFSELYHHESVSRGTDNTPDKAARLASEKDLMQARWGDRLRRDPFYSPNLTQTNENFGFNNPAPAWSWSRPPQATAS